MGIGNYASALRCVNYALMDSGLGDDDRKAIKEKMEVDLNLSARSVKNRGRWMQCRAK